MTKEMQDQTGGEMKKAMVAAKQKFFEQLLPEMISAKNPESEEIIEKKLAVFEQLLNADIKARGRFFLSLEIPKEYEDKLILCKTCQGVGGLYKFERKTIQLKDGRTVCPLDKVESYTVCGTCLGRGVFTPQQLENMRKKKKAFNPVIDPEALLSTCIQLVENRSDSVTTEK